MVWPEPGEALDRTVAAEQAIEDLHAEAFARWAPIAAAAALPVVAGAVVAPNVAALASTVVVGEWAAISSAVITAGVAALFAAAVVEAMTSMGIPLPKLPSDPDWDGPSNGQWIPWRIDPDVLAIIDRAVGDMDAEQVQDAVSRVQFSESLKAAMGSAAEAQLERAAAVPAAVEAKAAAAVSRSDTAVEVQRAAVADALDPAGDTLQGVAKREGYQAAGVLNAATIVAAQQQNEEFGEELHKCWISTLDGRTRDSHFRADGARVPIDAKFKVGVAELAYPGDPTGPPEEVFNCRCRLGILAADEPLPDEIDRHTERLDGRDSVAINRDGRTQAEEIERRRRAGNIRARDSNDGTGRVASAEFEENNMTISVIGGPTSAELAAELGPADLPPELVDDQSDEDPDFAGAVATLTAAVDTEPRLRTYDPRLFEDPKLTRPTAPSMNNETGRIYGHLAEWGHVIRGGRDVTPRNRNGYRNFHTGQVQTSDGRQLSVGRLSVLGGHASTEPGVTVAAARAHYDDVSTAFGLVRVGEDRFGIWFSGVPYPGVDPEVFQQGMVTQLSGDWRDCDGHPLDMIAAHAVNTQGFPIYSAQTGPDGRQMAMVAALGPVRRQPTPTHVLASVDELKAAVAEVLDERERAAEFAARRDAALTAAHAAVGDPPTPSERINALIEALPKA